MALSVLGVLGLMVVNAIPTTVGVAQAISAQKKQNSAQKDTAQFHLTVMFNVDGSPVDEDEDEEFYLVLVDSKLHVDHPSHPVPGHKFNGYYFTYPSEEQHRGLVSTIQEEPPMLNWIYVDADTRALRYAGRKDTIGHVIGPWGWTEDERWLVLRESEEGFAALREADGRWAVYWDPDGELRRQKGEEGVACVGVTLRRRMRLGMESRYVKGEKKNR